MIFEHKSVLLEETVDSLKIVPDGIYVDGTLGGGGHAARVLSRLGPSGRLVGIDQDEDAVRAATEHLNDYKDKVIIVRSSYGDIRNVLQGLGIQRVNGIYLGRTGIHLSGRCPAGHENGPAQGNDGSRHCK